MKNRLIIIGAVITLCFTYSCRKGSSGSSIIGTWAPYQVAYDLNSNGIMDPSEESLDTNDKGVTFTFNANHTMVVLQSGVPWGAIQWYLLYNNTYLETKDTTGGFNSIVYNKVDNLSSSTLTLRDTTGGSISWTIMKRQ